MSAVVAVDEPMRAPGDGILTVTFWRAGPLRPVGRALYRSDGWLTWAWRDRSMGARRWRGVELHAVCAPPQLAHLAGGCRAPEPSAA